MTPPPERKETRKRPTKGQGVVTQNVRQGLKRITVPEGSIYLITTETETHVAVFPRK